jgi:hypothetical protein
LDPFPHNSSDVFLAYTASDLAHSPLLNPEIAFFYHAGPSVPLQETPNSSFQTFTLPPPPRPRHATVEEVPDEDDFSILTRDEISILTHESDASVDNDNPETDLEAELARESAAGMLYPSSPCMNA